MAFILNCLFSPECYRNERVDTGPIYARPSVYLKAVGEPSLVGNTFITQCLRSVLPTAAIVHQDDFYFPTLPLPIDEVTDNQNLDCSDSIDSDRLLLYLKVFQENGL